MYADGRGSVGRAGAPLILLLSLAHASAFPSDLAVPSDEPGWLLGASGTSDGGLVALDAAGEVVWQLDETEGGTSFYTVEIRDGRLAACGERVTETGSAPFV